MKSILMGGSRRFCKQTLLIFSIIFFTLATGCSPTPPPAGYQPTSDDWVTINKDSSSQRYVDLDLINPSNVTNLRAICEVDLNEPSWFSSGILKIDRTLYFTTRRMTLAIDAVTCEKVWQYVNTEEPFPANLNNRGLAYLPPKDEHPAMLFRGTTNGHLFAFNADTGAIIWDNNSAADPTKLESIIAAPVAANGQVFVGVATADLGVCGHVMAFDAYTGFEQWRHYNVPVETNDKGELGCTDVKGGAQWTSLSLDAESKELFVPVSNPNPDYYRPPSDKPDLETNSVIVLDTDTGNLKWLYQAVPNDNHDWDLGTPPVLYTNAAGQSMVAIAGKDGFVYMVNRDTHKLSHKVSGTTQENVDSPFPINSLFPPKEAVRVCPGTIGGAQFNGASYDLNIDALFVGMNDFCWFYFIQEAVANPVTDPSHLTNADFAGFIEAAEGEEEVENGFTQPDFSLGKPPIGYVTAFNGSTGQKLWQFKAPAQVQAGTVATKGGIVFAADTLGFIYALDAKTGTELHRVNSGGAINSGLISYAVDNVQYVAAEVGGLSLNPPGITQPLRPEATLRFKIFALANHDRPVNKIKLDRFPILPGTNTPEEVGDRIYGVVCVACHGSTGKGGAYPTLERQYHILTDATRLKHFFETVPPPMPKLYPGLLVDDDIDNLVAYFKSLKNIEFQPGYTQPTSPGAPDWPSDLGPDPWPSIYSVFTHPRCINCHTTNDDPPTTKQTVRYPRQTDSRHPHIYGVLAGSSNQVTPAPELGSAITRCDSCHGDSNNKATGVPGAKPPPGQTGWQLAPLSDAWETSPNVPMDGAVLCEKIREYAIENPKKGGDTLHEHLNTFLVEWAFEPGDNLYGIPRSTPPLTLSELLAAVKLWKEGGRPCPL